MNVPFQPLTVKSSLFKFLFQKTLIGFLLLAFIVCITVTFKLHIMISTITLYALLLSYGVLVWLDSNMCENQDIRAIITWYLYELAALFVITMATNFLFLKHSPEFGWGGLAVVLCFKIFPNMLLRHKNH